MKDRALRLVVLALVLIAAAYVVQFYRARPRGPRPGQATLERAIFARARGRHAEALRLLDEVDKAGFVGARVGHERAINLIKLDRLDEAEKVLEHELATWPKYGPAHAARGRLFLRRKDPAAANNSFEYALSVDPSQLTLVEIAGAQYSGGDLDAAIATCERALATNRALWPAQSTLAKSLARKGQFERAMRASDQSLVLAPEDMKDKEYHFRAEMQLHAKNPESALAEYAKLAEIHTLSPRARWGHGSALHLKQDFAGAIADYEMVCASTATVAALVCKQLQKPLDLAKKSEPIADCSDCLPPMPSVD